jgi:hypothetical protein
VFGFSIVWTEETSVEMGRVRASGKGRRNRDCNGRGEEEKELMENGFTGTKRVNNDTIDCGCHLWQKRVLTFMQFDTRQRVFTMFSTSLCTFGLGFVSGAEDGR